MIFEVNSVCPACDKGELKHEVKATQFTYKNTTTTHFTDMYTCDVCNESFFNPDNTEALDGNLQHDRDKVDWYV